MLDWDKKLISIKVPKKQLPKHWGSYQEHVFYNGDVPGVLSGSELKGKAKQYGGKYHHSRLEVSSWVKDNFKISDLLIFSLEKRRYVRVWVSKNRKFYIRFTDSEEGDSFYLLEFLNS